MFPDRYSVLVLGSSDAGVFDFCTFLAGFYLKNDQSVVMLEADTSAAIVRRQLRGYGVRPEEHEGSSLTLIDCQSVSSDRDDESPADLRDLPDLLERIRSASEAHAEPVRVIFDSLSAVHLYSTPDEVADFLERLSNTAKKRGSLTATIHADMHDPAQIEALSEKCDGVIEMMTDERRRRFIRISRMRSIEVRPNWVPFDIGATASEGAALLWKRELVRER